MFSYLRVFVIDFGWFFNRTVREFSAKTNSKGVAVLRVIPRGKIKVQITASGFKTFGKIFKLVKKEESIEIELEKRD